MYTRYKYHLPHSIEYEYHWNGNCGAKGEKRAPKENLTPEQVRRQNQWKKERDARRTMKMNFTRGDLWCTLKYPKGTRKEISEVKRDVSNFLQRLKRAYKRRGQELKYMIRLEIGSKGGIHAHLIVNRLRGEPPDDILIQEKWSEGRVNFERFAGEEEDYCKLSEYLVKGGNEKVQERLDAMTPEERKALTAYSTSRNLIRPVPEKKKYTRRTMRSILANGPQPSPGYYIPPAQVITGINPFSGESYLYYTETKIRGGSSG